MKVVSILFPLALGVLALSSLEAQSPTPIEMQAIVPGSMTPTPAPATAAGAGVSTTDMQKLMQLVQEMQATNDATLKKQEAALQTLDALQKAAEEIKIFSKRG
ncbi:MAG TPA: hypothetical protein VK474_07055 [Chthoniobacterales bacterium]|nr:hypothetical protein [Chthoniobacterales bacterium]